MASAGIQSLPDTLPSTQSMFYMPVITHAYMLARGSRDIKDGLKQEILRIKQLELLSDEIYDIFVDNIRIYLQQNDSVMSNLEIWYIEDTSPGEGAGHISADHQEEILNAVFIPDNMRHLFSRFQSLENYSIKSIFDNIIHYHYYPNGRDLFYKNKYLKYKNKYSSLKNILTSTMNSDNLERSF
jgi:hypothetical protein